MFKAGLVSVSFRPLSPQEILARMQESDLSYVEWGSDVHAPCDDAENLSRIAAMQAASGVSCCSYGTYYRLGVNAPEEIIPYLRAAHVLGTNILRVWCGDKPYSQYTPEEAQALFEKSRAVARIAREHDAVICLECHNNTFTEELEGALAIMKAVDSPHLRMYWQPNQFKLHALNVAYAKAIAPYTTHLHVFHWEGRDKFPLAQGLDKWRDFLPAFEGDHMLLLEFMPDSRPESLPEEARALRALIATPSRRGMP